MGPHEQMPSPVLHTYDPPTASASPTRSPAARCGSIWCSSVGVLLGGVLGWPDGPWGWLAANAAVFATVVVRRQDISR